MALTFPTSLDTLTWHNQSACRDTDPGLFFPIGATGDAIEQIAHAKAVCDMCPTKRPCLDFVLTTNQDSGVWGGASEEERRTIRRRLARDRRAAKLASAVLRD